MKCRYFCRLPLDISPVYLTRGISPCERFHNFPQSQKQEKANKQNQKQGKPSCLIKQCLTLFLYTGNIFVGDNLIVHVCRTVAGKIKEQKYVAICFADQWFITIAVIFESIVFVFC